MEHGLTLRGVAEATCSQDKGCHVPILSVSHHQCKKP